MLEGNTAGTAGNGSAGDRPRVGVYICHCGGNISDVVDVERVVSAAAKLPDVVVARRNMFMCSDPGQKMIEEDIRTNGLNRVVVSACSPSLHELTFRGVLTRAGLNPYMLENANLREQVSWVSKHDPAGATDKAIRVVAAAVAKARLLRPLEPIRIPAYPRVTVVGGGIAGLRCALDLARLKLQVSVIERTPRLGGNLADLGKVYPGDKPAQELLRWLINEVKGHPGIDIYTESEIIDSTGCLGDFHLTVRTASDSGGNKALRRAGGHEFELNPGVVILATGFDHYQPAKDEYGYRVLPGVVTLPEFIHMLENGVPEINDRPVRSIAFIHCVGSRQLDGIHEPPVDGELNHYCSRVCCTAALWTINQVLDRLPEVQVYDLYRDIRTYGRGHEDYYEDTAERGVRFFRFNAESAPVVTAPEGDQQLLIQVKDTLTFDEDLEIPADLVVLVTGVVPHAIDRLVELLKLPRSADGFLQEVHPKLRPVELSVSGVLVAGTCQAPMDSVESCAAAAAAAAKASAILGKGYIEREPFVASVDPALCEGNGKCVEECDFRQAVSLVDIRHNGTQGKIAEVNAAICCGCGMCTAVCPTGAIQVEGWRTDQFEAMIEALIADYEKVV